MKWTDKEACKSYWEYLSHTEKLKDQAWVYKGLSYSLNYQLVLR